MRKFYYIPSKLIYINIDSVECVDLEFGTIHFIDGNELKKVPLDELELIMSLERGTYFENQKTITK